MRCVSYTRTTTCLRDETAEENVISQQNRIIRDYMKERGWKLDAKYSDRKNNEQEETAFQKMRLDGIARKFDMVVISSAFRCGRSVSFAEDLLLKTFYPAGIHFAVAKDGFCSMEHSQQEAEEYLCAKRRESNVSCMRHAEREKERQGLFDVHDEKYGYLLKDDFSGFVIDEEVVPIIREIFQLLADNMTMQAVADLLNERGVESPAVHLERVGRKNFHANGRKWALGSVQRILQNTAYIGYWTKMVGGKPQTVDIPAVVEKEIFERAIENVTSRGRKMPEDVIRSENAFVKQIFDKETGQPLVCRRYTDDGDYQMFHKNWFAVTRGISYKAVEEAVVSAVYAEKELAEKIASLICSDKAAKELDGRVAILSEEAKQIFSQMAEYKRDSLRAYQAFRDGNLTKPELQVVSQQTTDKLSVLDQQFDEVMEAVNKVKTAYSMKNPWLSHYRKAELHGEVTKKDVRKWVDRIVVENLHYIDVELIRQEWKSFFPAEWMEGGSADGKKKQTYKNAPQGNVQEPVIKNRKETLIATGAYARLSVENETDDTLQTQITMLHSYITNHPELELTDTYIDNGYSGTNFDRPEFIRLMDDVRSGRISCIVVKDLSRFGRDYLETGYYLETLFPHLNVRFIAVTDDFDSFREGDLNSLSVPLKNMVNTMYAKDISRKQCAAAKIRAKREGAMPNGTAPYGYRFTEDKTGYIEDPLTAPYVRMIYHWAVQGIEVKKIAERMTLIGAITPGQNRNGTDVESIQPKAWRSDMVYKILKHPVYTGNVYLGRFEQALYKSQSRRWTQPEEQVVRENTHLPLVTQDDYQTVQDNMLNEKRWKMRRNQRNIAERERLQDGLPGMVYCAECGRQMYFRRGTHDWRKGINEGREKVLTMYVCEKRHGMEGGCGQTVYEDFLQIVAADQIHFLMKTLADREELLKKLTAANSDKHPLISVERQIANLKVKIKDKENMSARLYMNYAEGILPIEDYTSLKEQYSQEAEVLQQKLAALERKKAEIEKILNQHHALIQQISEQEGSRELDQKLIQEMIERFTISSSGNIEVRFKCQDVVRNMMKLMEGCDV